ncbi:MAG: single-stranded-DNA-specific exonuclease RecJ, partial [Candidatus Kapabacteria bacterium]|nr:single-stranded-DNA-specific exonuclease RecJ [Candidatus Kapabacteria bacterium]
MNYRWVFRESPDDSIIQQLTDQLRVPKSLARVLASRGLHSETDARGFFTPELHALHDPFIMDGMEKAVSRIERAVKNKETIWIHGDYDVDGTSSTAMTLQFLREIGASAQYYIPDRMTEGYGLSEASINKARSVDATLLITVDCGITSNEV